METFLTFLVTGLTLAAIYAVGASGLVLTYTTTGIFNFAHGAVGMFGAFVYWQLRFEWGWPAPIALACVLLVLAPAFGAFVEIAIFRNLQGTSDATRLVVSISLFAFMVGLASWIWKPGVQRTTAKFFEGNKFEVAGIFVTWHEAITVAVALIVAGVLRFVLYRLRAGIAMRAAVDDRPLASLNGARPDRSSMLAWAIGCSLAALSGILFIGTLALDSGVLSLLIVNAYAAAIVGRLRSLPLTFVGALILGLAESFWQLYHGDLHFGFVNLGSDYFAAFGSAVSVIVLFVALLVLPQRRLRGHSSIRSREFWPTPSWRGALTFAGVVVASTVLASGLMTRAHQLDLAKVFGLGIIALSLVPLMGFAGQVSLCQLSFAGIGAVTMAHLGAGGTPMGLVWAAVITGAVGALIALPALRLSGIYLALATAAFAVALDRWFFRLPPFTLFGEVDIRLFETGSVAVARLRILGIETTTARAQAIMLSVAFSLLALVVVGIRRSAFGRRLLAMKDSEAACATLGMNLTGTKVTVFALSAAMAGVGGALYGGLQRSINPDMFSFINGVPIFMMTVVGGMGAIGGALFAGVALGAFVLIPTIVPALSNVMLVTPGSIGISLGRTPTGASADIAESFRTLRESAIGQAVLIASLLGVWLLAAAGVVGNWAAVVLSLLALGAVNIGLEFLANRRQTTTLPGDAAEVPLEWVGIDRPFRPADARALDERLGLGEVRVGPA